MARKVAAQGGTIGHVPSLFRDPVVVTYVDPDNTEIAVTTYSDVLPRVGENIRIRNVPYLVERIGYDLPEQTITHIWIVCRRA